MSQNVTVFCLFLIIFSKALLWELPCINLGLWLWLCHPNWMFQMTYMWPSSYEAQKELQVFICFLSQYLNVYEYSCKPYEIPPKLDLPFILNEVNGERGNSEKTERVNTTNKTVYMAAPCTKQCQELINEYPHPKTGNLMSSSGMSEPVSTVFPFLFFFLPENLFLQLVNPYFTMTYWVRVAQIAGLFTA